jgi:hypothetical protein
MYIGNVRSFDITRRMFEFVNEILYSINSLYFCFRFMLNNRIQYRHAFLCDIFLNFLLRFTIDQARFQIGENNISNVEFLVGIHMLELNNEQRQRT